MSKNRNEKIREEAISKNYQLYWTLGVRTERDYKCLECGDTGGEAGLIGTTLSLVLNVLCWRY